MSWACQWELLAFAEKVAKNPQQCRWYAVLQQVFHCRLSAQGNFCNISDRPFAFQYRSIAFTTWLKLFSPTCNIACNNTSRWASSSSDVSCRYCWIWSGATRCLSLSTTAAQTSAPGTSALRYLKTGSIDFGNTVHNSSGIACYSS